MYIRRKVFSLLQDESGEERYFSTTDIVLEDEEERLFSLVDDEDLEQREFARKDYEGLTEAQQRVLKRHRSEYARSLNKLRNERSAKNIKKILEDNRGWNNIQTSNVVEGGGVKSTIRADVSANSLDNYDTLSRRTSNTIKNEALKASSDAKKIMRDELERGIYDDEVKSVEKASERLKNMKANKASKKAAKKVANTAKTAPSRVAEETAEKVTKRSLKLGKGGKIALGTAAGLGALYGAKKLYDRNKKDKK